MICLLAVGALELVAATRADVEAAFGETLGPYLVVYLAVMCVSVAVSAGWASMSRAGLVDAIGLMAAIGAALVHVAVHVDDYTVAWQALPLFWGELLLLTVYAALPIGLCTAPLLAGASAAWEKWGP